MILIIKTVLFVLHFVKAEKYTRFSSCNCSVNEEYAKLQVCNLKAIDRETVVTNVELDTLKNITNSSMHLHTYQATGTGRFNKYLFDYKDSVCDVIKDRSPSFILKQTKRIILKYSNIVRCEIPVSIFNKYDGI